MEKTLQKFLHKLTRLRQGVTAYGAAPHKPVLLLAVLQGIDKGWINENRIELSPELVSAFKSIWNRVVTTAHSPLIAQPFFHMRGEKLWHHVPGYDSKGCLFTSISPGDGQNCVHRRWDNLFLRKEELCLMN